MAFIYQADIWCDDCGQKIRDTIDSGEEGTKPEDPDDETSYDSDEYPKRCGDDEESDSPQHCAAGEHCINAIELANGVKVGMLFGSLTTDGVKYVQDKLDEAGLDEEADLAYAGNEVLELWYNHYREAGYDLRITAQACRSPGCKNDMHRNYKPFCRPCWLGVLEQAAKLLRKAGIDVMKFGGDDCTEALGLVEDLEARVNRIDDEEYE